MELIPASRPISTALQPYSLYILYHIVVTETETAHTPPPPAQHHRLVGSLYPGRAPRQSGSQEGRQLLCRLLPRMRHTQATVFPLLPTGTFLSASHYWNRGERETEREAIIMNLYDIKLAWSGLTGQSQGHECHWKFRLQIII